MHAPFNGRLNTLTLNPDVARAETLVLVPTIWSHHCPRWTTSDSGRRARVVGDPLG